MKLTAPLVGRATVTEVWARPPRAHSRAGAAAYPGCSTDKEPALEPAGSLDDIAGHVTTSESSREATWVDGQDPLAGPRHLFSDGLERTPGDVAARRGSCGFRVGSSRVDGIDPVTPGSSEP